MATNTYVALDKVTVSGSSTSSITFSSIPATYTDLVLVSNFGMVSNSSTIIGRFNGDGSTTGLYSDTNILGNGSTATSNRDTNNNHFYLSVNPNASTTNVATFSTLHFMNYANTSVFKTYLLRNNSPDAATSPGVEASVGLYRSTNAISSIVLTASGSNIVSGQTYRDWETDRKSTRLNSSHSRASRMPSSA